MDTNTIGKLTELKVLQYAIERGVLVSIPFGDKERYDQIWDINGKLFRIQIKTARPNDEQINSIVFNCRTTYSRKTGSKTHHYNKNEVDFFATFWDNVCYLIPLDECGDKKVLRFLSKQNSPNISWAKDYEFDNIISKIY